MDEILGILKAMADETRLKIINLLLTHDFCVGALAKRLDLSEAAVSQHLQVLRKAGVVKGEKRGYWTHYWVDREVLNQAAENIKMVASQTQQSEGNCRKDSLNETKCCGKEDKDNV